MKDELTKTNAITLSIIIATFNAGGHLEACLRSITSQTFKSLEIIVVDGGSTDDTISILKKFDSKVLSWTSKKDKGIYDALNKGTKMANGKWFYFPGADDRLLPGFSELASKLKDENSVYYGDSEAYYTGENDPPYILLSGKFTKYRLAKYCINHQAIIYPAAAFKKYHYNLKYKVFADYDLNIKIWGDDDFKKIYYPVTIAQYNMNGFSSVTNDVLFRKDKPALIRKNMGWPIYLRFLYKRYKKKLLGEKGFE